MANIDQYKFYLFYYLKNIIISEIADSKNTSTEPLILVRSNDLGTYLFIPSVILVLEILYHFLRTWMFTILLMKNFFLGFI